MFWGLTLIFSFLGIFVFLILAVIALLSNIREKRIAVDYFMISGLCVAVVFVSMLNIGKSQVDGVRTESQVASASFLFKDIKESKNSTGVYEQQMKEEEEAIEEIAQQNSDSAAKKRFEEEAKANAERAEKERSIKQALDKYMYVNFKYYGETSWYNSVSATGCVIDSQGRTFIIQSKGKSYNEKAKQFLEAALGFFNSRTTKPPFLVDKVILIDHQSNIIKEEDTFKWQ